MNNKDNKDDKDIFLSKVKKTLIDFGIDLNKKTMIADADGGNSCFMKGDFAGYSLNSLIKYYAAQTGKKVKWINTENYN